jgi:Nickel-dependent hydrogenase
LHPAPQELYKLNLVCEGEAVRDPDLKIGFNFQGIEYLAERRDYAQVIALMERVCGICSNVHTLSICQAIERLPESNRPKARSTFAPLFARLLPNLSGCCRTYCGTNYGHARGHFGPWCELGDEPRWWSESRHRGS